MNLFLDFQIFFLYFLVKRKKKHFFTLFILKEKNIKSFFSGRDDKMN